jgi:hypothetical protein
MSLYLCIFAGDRELDGVEAGPYADFNALRHTILQEFGGAAAAFPTLLGHSDCDGEWSPSDCVLLGRELAGIAAALKQRPAIGFPSVWQAEVARSIGLNPRNAFECFIDVDGQFLLDRLQHLAELAVQHQLPILFQ